MQPGASRLCGALNSVRACVKKFDAFKFRGHVEPRKFDSSKFFRAKYL